MEAHSVARQYNLIPPTMEKPQYNLLHRYRVEQEYKRLYDTIGLGTLFAIFVPGNIRYKYTGYAGCTGNTGKIGVHGRAVDSPGTDFFKGVCALAGSARKRTNTLSPLLMRTYVVLFAFVIW